MQKISVIVPVYKVEQYLNRCIDSIISQTFSDFELILVDDGSPDKSPQMCDEWTKKDNRVQVIHQKNGGLSAARNAGIDRVFENNSSEWITFIDSDDWLHPQYLEILYKNSIETDCNISVCGYIQTNGEEPCVDIGETFHNIYISEDFFVKKNANAVIACAKLYKKDLFKNIRYPIGRIHEDEFTTYKLLFNESKIVYTEAPLYFYMNNETGITKSEWNIKKLDAIDALREQSEFFLQNGFQSANESVQIKCAKVLADNIYSSKKSSNYLKHKRVIKTLERNLRKHLRNNRHLLPKETNKWIYEIAHPLISRFRWTIIGLSNKFIRG